MNRKTKTSDIFFGLGALMIIISFYASNPYMDGRTPLSVTIAVISLILVIIGAVYLIKKK